MPDRPPSNFLIDTGGIDLFVDPPDEEVRKWWKVIQDRQHAICEVVYWEFLRKYDKHEHDRDRSEFLAAVEDNRLYSLPFDRRSAKLAISIYHGVKGHLPMRSNEERRHRMNALQCDIMIAAIAVRHGRAVVTDDLTDWAFIREIVVHEHLGNLPIVTLKEMRDPNQWKQ